MAVQEPVSAPTAGTTGATRGQALEGIAFTFCKASTIILLAHLLVPRQFVLALCAGTASLLFVLSYLLGQRTSRCILRMPLLIAAFWAAVCLLSLFKKLGLQPFGLGR